MLRIIAVANQKGGVGKTTTSVNLSAAVAEAGKRVLLIDADPQGNATSGCGINKREVRLSTYDAIIGGAAAKDCILKTSCKNLWIMPSHMNLAGAELELVEMQSRESRLKNCIETVKDEFDFIFIDCPPSLGLLTLNALCLAGSILVPIQCEFYALEGLSQLTNTIRHIKKLYNASLELEGVLLTMYDGRLNLTIQVVEEVKRFFPQKVFKTVIPRNVRLSEAPSHGQPITEYDKYSKGAIAYRELAKELIK